MKIAGYILALYIILLAATPCCIIDNRPDDKTEEASGHPKDDQDCGNCSPFFSCEGCAAATIAYEPVHFELNSVKEEPVFTFYLQLSLPEVKYDFWQPPKLG